MRLVDATAEIRRIEQNTSYGTREKNSQIRALQRAKTVDVGDAFGWHDCKTSPPPDDSTILLAYGTRRWYVILLGYATPNPNYKSGVFYYAWERTRQFNDPEGFADNEQDSFLYWMNLPELPKK